MALGVNARTACSLLFPPILSERVALFGEPMHERNHRAET
jgi:hypothetical protein